MPNDLQKLKSESLPLNLPLKGQREAWIALAQAAQALLNAASAALGENVPLSGLPAHSHVCPSVVEVINELMRTKARVGRCNKYLHLLRYSLKSFADGRAHQPLSEVTISDIEAWLDNSDFSLRTQRGYLGNVRLLFNYAHRRGYIASNPANAVELPDDSGHAPPVIHTPEEVKTILEAMRSYDLNVCRALAIRYFAGLRAAEAQRLSENEIYLERGFIEVTAAKAKTRQRRLVTIQPALRAWLELGGTVPLRNAAVRLAGISRIIGKPWPKNVARHSFVSYHLAQFQNASKTALEAGHSEQMLFKHYRELVTPEAAAEFWAIRPLGSVIPPVD